ncbi:MAG: hypothetical protein K6C97_10880 [Treponema sp.]|nr:hypothetical protein [Treponema sp.]
MKTYKKFKYSFLLLCLVCLFLFNMGCGLDVFYVIEAPTTIIHSPSYDSTDFSESYFAFYTNETNISSTSGLKFKGTEVYYRIFDSSSQMQSEVNTLVSLSNDDSTSSTAADTMIKSYGFSKLRVKDNYEEPLIPYSGTNKNIYIRLTDYQDIEAYSARILEDGASGTYLNSATSKTVPVRNAYYTFNFGRDGSTDKVPEKDDDDFDYISGPTDSKYYVAMFAVAFGYDAAYTNYYSNILYLGSVTIDASTTDN